MVANVSRGGRAVDAVRINSISLVVLYLMRKAVFASERFEVRCLWDGG